MWSPGAETAILRIRQVGPVEEAKPGQFRWNLHCQLCTSDETVYHQQAIQLLEPFTRLEYERVAKYLDEDLDNETFYQPNADNISNFIDTYRPILFERLFQSEFCRNLSIIRPRTLEIHVWSDRRNSQRARSIHSIEWEQLEDLTLWAGTTHDDMQLVTVCRHIDVTPPARGRPHHVMRTSHRPGTPVFDILLVVARPHVHDTPEEARRAFSVFNPATIRSILVQLQEELKNAGSPQRINLEIVRPGCFKTLRMHLENRERAHNGTRPYHIVHFDMHGGIDNGRAFLQFNGYTHNEELGTEQIYANELAPLLRRHQIGCVILNACKTAVAHAGPTANLTAGFLSHGISAVLAMSHNMHDSVSNRYYSKFYHEFLVRRTSISVAASKARRVLVDDPWRYNYSNREMLKMQDWFIPVVYTSTEAPYQFPEPGSWIPGSLFGAVSVQDLFFALIGFLVVHCLVSGTLYGWIEVRSVSHHDPDFYTSSVPAQLQKMSIVPLLWVPIQIFRRLCHDLTLRQWLRVLAEDRQNTLRLEGSLSRKRMVLLHSEKNVEDEAGSFLSSLAAIWERTSFVAFGGAISAEWFLQPNDLTIQDEWKLWAKACANWVCLWVYSVRHRHVSLTKKEKSLVIIKHLDILYPEPVELARMQYYVPAQERFEDWLKEHFPLEKKGTAPYLLLTALRGRSLGDNVSKWIENGPGRCEVLDSIVTTAFAKMSTRHMDPNNKLFYRDKYYDWGLRWFCGDVSRPIERGLLSALWDLPGTLLLRTPYDANT